MNLSSAGSVPPPSPTSMPSDMSSGKTASIPPGKAPQSNSGSIHNQNVGGGGVVGGTNVNAVNTATQEVFSTPQTSIAAPPPLNTHKYTPTTAQTELKTFLENIHEDKEIAERGIDDTKNRLSKVNVITSMVAHGALLALGMGIIVAAVAVTWIFCPGVAGVVVTGFGLVAGSLLLAYTGHKMAEYYSDFPKESDVGVGEKRLKLLETALDLLHTTQEKKLSFENFLDQQFPKADYNVDHLGYYMKLYDIDTARLTNKENLAEYEEQKISLEEDLSRLIELQQQPAKELQKAYAHEESLGFGNAARASLIPEFQKRINELDKKIAELTATIDKDLEEKEATSQSLKKLNKKLKSSGSKTSKTLPRKTIPLKEEERKKLQVEKAHLKAQIENFEAISAENRAKIQQLRDEIVKITKQDLPAEIQAKQTALKEIQANISKASFNSKRLDAQFAQKLQELENIKNPKKKKTKAPKDAPAASTNTPMAKTSTTTPDALTDWIQGQDSKSNQQGSWPKPGEALPLMFANVANPAHKDEHAFLSANDDSVSFTVEGKEYASPTHYVLQKMAADAKHDQLVEALEGASVRDAIEISKQVPEAYKDADKAAEYLKRALFAKFVIAGTHMPTDEGLKLIQTDQIDLVAIGEPVQPAWGWGTVQNATTQQYEGFNKVGIYLQELREWLRNENPEAVQTAI